MPSANPIHRMDYLEVDINFVGYDNEYDSSLAIASTSQQKMYNILQDQRRKMCSMKTLHAIWEKDIRDHYNADVKRLTREKNDSFEEKHRDVIAILETF